jgi:hypothetical protein
MASFKEFEEIECWKRARESHAPSFEFRVSGFELNATSH